MRPHQIAFFIYPGVAPYDIAGPAQAFSISGSNLYTVSLVSLNGGLIESDCPGISFSSISTKDFSGTQVDTLVLPGGNSAIQLSEDNGLVSEIENLSSQAGRIATICTGAFLAAAANLLVEKKATTHWRYCDEFNTRYPNTLLERDQIWVRDDYIWSSAGVSAGVDLALALIEHDYGVQTALKTAKELVVFLKRPGGQSQYSTVLAAQIADITTTLNSLLVWMADNLDSDLRLEKLAEKAGMSLRNFVRQFTHQTKLTPAKAVEIMRVQAAREAVESGLIPLATIAVRYGFQDEQRMRRAFVRQLGVTPTEIRSRFSKT